MPLEHRTLRIVPGAADIPPPPHPAWDGFTLSNRHVTVGFGPEGVASIRREGQAGNLLSAPLEWKLLDDPSDTWSHGVQRYGGDVRSVAQFGPVEMSESGPLRCTVTLPGVLGNSPCRLRVTLDADDPVIQIDFQINCVDGGCVLKASLLPRVPLATSRHHVAGGWLDRPMEGLEVPLHHALLTTDRDGQTLGLILPDTFAVDVLPSEIRPTILRNSIHAFHASQSSLPGRQPELGAIARREGRFGTDDGPQSQRIHIVVDPAATCRVMEGVLDRIQRPPYLWDDFRGQDRLHRFDSAVPRR